MLQRVLEWAGSICLRSTTPSKASGLGFRGQDSGFRVVQHPLPGGCRLSPHAATSKKLWECMAGFHFIFHCQKNNIYIYISNITPIQPHYIPNIYPITIHGTLVSNLFSIIPIYPQF